MEPKPGRSVRAFRGSGREAEGLARGPGGLRKIRPTRRRRQAQPRDSEEDRQAFKGKELGFRGPLQELAADDGDDAANAPLPVRKQIDILNLAAYAGRHAAIV